MIIGSTGQVLGSDSATQKPAKVRDGQAQNQSRNQTQPLAPVSVIRAPSQTSDIKQAEDYQRFSRETENGLNREAVARYMQLEKMEQRERIQSMFGVDTFA